MKNLKMKKEFKVIADLLPNNTRVLDVGCGDGSLMNLLVKEKNIEVNLQRDLGKIIGKSYTVSVKDKGIGIPSDKIERVTERFFRADAKKSKKVGGTGLGLAIVKHIIKQHRGDLEIKSVPQNGTETKVHLPIF